MASLLDLKNQLEKILNQAGNSVGQTAQSVGNYFNPNIGVIQQPRQLVSPLAGRQPIQVPQVRSFWTDIPAVNPNQIVNNIPQIKLSELQNSPLNFPAKIGASISPFKSYQNNPMVKTASNVIGGIGENLVNTPINVGQGAARATLGTLQGKPQQALGGLGQWGSAMLNVVPITKGAGAVETLGKQTFKTAVKDSALIGGTYGGLQGFLNGLSDGRDYKTLNDQVGEAIKQGTIGMVIGAAIGIPIGATSAAVGILKNGVRRVLGSGASESEVNNWAGKVGRSFFYDYRNPKGQFAKKPLTESEIQMIGDMREAIGAPRFGSPKAGYVRIGGGPSKSSVTQSPKGVGGGGITLYHGTHSGSKSASGSLGDLLTNSYNLTDNAENAMSYAKQSAERTGNKPVVQKYILNPNEVSRDPVSGEWKYTGDGLSQAISNIPGVKSFNGQTIILDSGKKVNLDTQINKAGELEIDNLQVQNEAQGKGVGTNIVNKILQYAKDNNLTVRVKDSTNNQFWSKFGGEKQYPADFVFGSTPPPLNQGGIKPPPRLQEFWNQAKKMGIKNPEKMSPVELADKIDPNYRMSDAYKPGLSGYATTGEEVQALQEKFLSAPLNQGGTKIKVSGNQLDPFALKQLKYQPEVKTQVNQSNLDVPTFMRGVNKNQGAVDTNESLALKMLRPDGKLPPSAVEATNKIPETKLSIQEPQLTGGNGANGQVPPSSGQSIDPVTKIINALKGAKPIRGQQEAIYAKIRSQQSGALAGIGKQMGGEAGFYKKLGQLKGEMPKVSFESIKSQFQQPELDALFNKVEASNLTPFEKITAQGGLKKLLGAEGGVIPNRSELELLNEVFPPEFTQAVLDNRPAIQKLFSLGNEVLNMPRSLMASFDMSAPLRQGVFLGPSHPKEWAGAFKDMFKYAGSEKAYQGMLDDIAKRPTYQAMREAKLAITKPTPILSNREEQFMSNLAERIPGIGRIVKASDRAYSGFLTKLRADVFDSLYKDAKAQGLGDDVIKNIGEFVNTGTGRGDLGVFNRAATTLNGIFFSPRLLASRLQILNPQFYYKMDPFTRKEALKSLFTFAGTAGTILGISKLAGADVGLDPRSADFAKIKIGNTRYDILGGFQQPIRLASQLISGKLISSTTGKEYTLGEGYKPLTRKDILFRFVESKEAPVMSFVTQLMQGQNSIGEDFNIGKEAVNRVIPMMAADMYDLAKEWGPKGLLMGVPGIFGVGSQTYGRNIPSIEQTPAGNPTIKLNPVPGLTEDIYNKITGNQVTNVPQNQWQGLVDAKNQSTQQAISLDKAKQALQTGKSSPDLKQATFNIDGQDYNGFQVGNKFVYVDENGDQQTKSMEQIKSSEKGMYESEYSLAADRLKRADDSQGWIGLTQNYVDYLKDYKTQITNKKDQLTVQNKIEDLQSQLDKYKSYGGFTKGKKPPKITIKSAKITLPKVKLSGFKIKAPPKYKGLKIKGQSNRRYSIKA